MILLHMHLKLEEFHFLMIISFISVVSGGVPLCPGQNLAREEAGLRATAYTSHVSLEVPRDTLPGTAAACEIGFQRGVVLLLGTYGGGDREGRGNKDCLHIFIHRGSFRIITPTFGVKCCV